MTTSSVPPSFKFPEPNEEECLKALQGLVKIKSYSKTDGEKEATEYMVKLMKEIGIESEIKKFDNGKRQNALGIWKGNGQGKSLLFNGHLDTNPVTEGWTVDPWGGIIKDDCIFGIGVSNMKAGCAAYFCAVKTLIESGWKPKGDVVLTHVVGELQGGPGTVALIEQGYCNVDYFVNCEPTDLKAITMHAESHIFRIELTGITRHMSKREDATDALLAASYLIPKLDELTFANAKNDDVKACNRCHVGVVKAGLGKEMADWRPPQVADFAIIRGAARFGPGQTSNDVENSLEICCIELQLKFPFIKYEIFHERSDSMPSFEVSKNSYIVKTLNKIYEKVRLGEKQPTGALSPQCFFGSDAGHLYKKLGLQGIVCGPGGKFNTMPDERVEIVDYMDCIKIFIRLIVEISG
ncbi:uncharacterized protein I206_106331 [Kwoniella pini CBS 10737]|uniref:Acetylornithine deacetylase n=1 Tax=Kwoniella pini CBS 10737 TaxID=1296096 RepID=A0A1B9HTZ9_9TREE|nr:uncharacterized protein I206_07133 [Kwoniella pini CBS 10737]OCF46746.1 hypothetical protein I206_07133 [Kwoniella pini CBS 10737]